MRLDEGGLGGSVEISWDFILYKMCILYCLVLLNSVLFKPCLFRSSLER